MNHALQGLTREEERKDMLGGARAQIFIYLVKKMVAGGKKGEKKPLCGIRYIFSNSKAVTRLKRRGCPDFSMTLFGRVI